MYNVLFNPETNRLTALLDYKFSHIASRADEYFFSFPYLGAMLMWPAPRKNGEDVVTLRDYLLHGFPSESALRNSAFQSWELAEILDEEFAKASVQRLRDIQGIDELSSLNWFIQNIGFLLGEHRDKVGGRAFKRVTEDILECSLEYWGY